MPQFGILCSMDAKQRAGEAAVKFVHDGMAVGLGTGSTADFFLKALGNALHEGQVRNIRGVPTSLNSEHRARELGIPLTTLATVGRLDVTIDGADEVDPNLDLIKGLGGALLREKIVAQNSAKLVIIVDSTKVVPKLGTHSMLPVEVVQFAHETQERFLRTLGAIPRLRRDKDGRPYVTDNGNYIYDCRFDNGIEKAHLLEHALRSRAGIIETGLFFELASVVLVADEEKVQERGRGK